MSDRPVRYGVILLDENPPVVLQARGTTMVFRSAEETLEYALLHGLQRWMVFGDPEGWWPIYTPDGPISEPPPAKKRVDISLQRGGRPRAPAPSTPADG